MPRCYQFCSLSFLSLLSLAITLPAIADENVQRSLDTMLDNSLKTVPIEQNNSVAQVNAVSQLSDVRPTDWAFTALQSLVERYGCISGYPDRTFRGNQALSRYEFAAGLNACLDKVNEIISAGLADKVGREDLATLSRLQEEFAAELATLRGRVDSLEAKTSKLEAQQFSTTTKLSGEAIFAVSGASTGGDTLTSPFGGTAPSKQNIVFQNRVRLNLLTSFTGSDRLRTRLQAGNAQPLLTFNNNFAASLLASNDGRLGFDDSTTATNKNSVFLEALDYSFPLGDRARVTVFANGGNHFYYADTLNPYLDDQGGGKGAISRFGERNPIYGINGNGAGIGFNYKINDNFKLDAGYLANTANNPTSATGSGLTGGNYSALAQLVFQPSDRFKAGLTYVLGYNGTSAGQTGFRYGGAGQATGSFLSNLIAGARFIPTDAASATIPTTPVASNSYGAQFSYAFSPNFVVGGWAGYTSARLFSLGDADIWNYALSFAFPNLGKEGNLLGIVVGVEPTLKGLRTYAGASLPLANNDVWHIEAFYKYQVTNNISITPGVVWIANPNQVSSNSNLFVGTVRTTFSF